MADYGADVIRAVRLDVADPMIGTHAAAAQQPMTGRLPTTATGASVFGDRSRTASAATMCTRELTAVGQAALRWAQPVA